MSKSSTHESSENFSVLGVDLAAQPDNTALCEITISNRVPEVTRLEEDCDDTLLMAAFRRCNIERIGIDSPFGWPIAFVNALSKHGSRAGFYDWPRNDPEVYAGPQGKSTEEYRDLKYRATDLVVWKRVKKPISVAVNSLGSVAIRNASLLSRADAEGLSVDRSGRTGRFVEVYPGAAFAQWDIDTTGYKKKKEDGGEQARVEVLKQVKARARVLEFNDEIRQNLSESDHVVDAFASAIVALMAEIDHRIAPEREDPKRLTYPIPPGMEELAKREGWIALPTKKSLERLEESMERLRSSSGGPSS